MNPLETKIDSLIQKLQRNPDIGLIQLGPEYRIVNRSTGKVLETCHTEEAAKRVLELHREQGK